MFAGALEFQERDMLTIRAFNDVATIYLADYVSSALCLRRDTERQVTATQEAVAHSRALMVEVDALIAEAREKGLAAACVPIGA
jgi:hypothetical protein